MKRWRITGVDIAMTAAVALFVACTLVWIYVESTQ